MTDKPRIVVSFWNRDAAMAIDWGMVLRHRGIRVFCSDEDSLRYDNIAPGQRHKPLPGRKPMNNFEDALKAALRVGVRGIMTSRGARASTPCGAQKERGAA
jgi:hypothetical protein